MAEKSPQKRTNKQTKQEAVMMARDLTNTVLGNTSNLEFRMMILKVLAGLKKGMEDIRKTLPGEVKALSREIKN